MKILTFMRTDKKNISKKIIFILINKIGKVTYNNFYKIDEISKFFKNQFFFN